MTTERKPSHKASHKASQSKFEMWGVFCKFHKLSVVTVSQKPTTTEEYKPPRILKLKCEK